jgi:hypothetical protein
MIRPSQCHHPRPYIHYPPPFPAPLPIKITMDQHPATQRGTRLPSAHTRHLTPSTLAGQEPAAGRGSECSPALAAAVRPCGGSGRGATSLERAIPLRLPSLPPCLIPWSKFIPGFENRAGQVAGRRRRQCRTVTPVPMAQNRRC